MTTAGPGKRERLRPAEYERSTCYETQCRSTCGSRSGIGIGHIEDFIIDDENWAIRYLIVDTRNWWPGKKVLVAPQWIERVSWKESKVYINLSRETIKQSPEYTESLLLTREYETRLHGHYHLQGYWVDESVPEKHSR